MHEDQEGNTLWPQDDFSGEWEILWPSGILKFTGSYFEGNPHGDYLCYWENGVLAQKGKYEHGQCIGIWEDFHENGSKYKETHYKDSSNFIEKWMSEDGSVYDIKTFGNGLK